MSEPASGASKGTGRAVAGAAGLLAGSVLIARVLGYLRDALFASEVGVGSGADAYFAKPYSPAEVRQTLERLLDENDKSSD